MDGLDASHPLHHTNNGCIAYKLLLESTFNLIDSRQRISLRFERFRFLKGEMHVIEPKRYLPEFFRLLIRLVSDVFECLSQAVQWKHQIITRIPTHQINVYYYDVFLFDPNVFVD